MFRWVRRFVGRFRFTIFVVEASFDVIESSSVSSRRFGFKDFLGFFSGLFGEGFDTDVVPGVSVLRIVEESGRISPLFVISFLFDIFQVFFRMFRALEVWMIRRSVEEPSVGCIEFLIEREESVEMRITVFVEFPTDTNVKRCSSFGFEYLSQMSNDILRSHETLGVGEENVLSLNAGHRDFERGSSFQTPFGG